MNMRKRLSNSTALRFVLLIGIVRLFADLTYEGARSITGPLGVLLLPALLCLGTLMVARLLYPRPQALETKAAAPLQTHGFPR